MKLKAAAFVIMGMMTSTAHSSEWGYQGAHGPEHWGKLAHECSQGKNQSPIDITKTVSANLEDLDIRYQGRVTGIVNNGHTLQAKVIGENTFNIDGVEFSLAQFHFHTPSENTIKSQQFPLEAHFVNADAEGNLAVIAVMYHREETQNAQLEKLLQAAPEQGRANTLAESFTVAELLPSSGEYYRFSGSLTTPPCSEGVRWIVMKEAKSLSADQVAKFEQVMGHNNRPLQPIHARKVLTQ